MRGYVIFPFGLAKIKGHRKHKSSKTVAQKVSPSSAFSEHSLRVHGERKAGQPTSTSWDWEAVRNLS